MAEAPQLGSRYSYADYLGWDDGQRWELIDGQPFAMSPAPLVVHQTLVGELFRQIGNALEGKPCQALVSPLDVRLGPTEARDGQIEHVVQPDILVVCDPDKLDERGVRGAPDFVVEVLSPSTASHDHIRKRRLYERFGVGEYWVVHPTDRIVAVYTLRGPADDTERGYGGPEFVAMEGALPVGVLSTEDAPVAVDWAPIVERLGPVGR
jgi:Uma2 family endonuclease